MHILTSSKFSLTWGGESTAPPIEHNSSYTSGLCEHWGHFALTGGVWPHVLVGFFVNKSSTSLINLHTHTFICMYSVSAAAQRCSTAWETLACRHLELLLKNQKLWNFESRTKEISVSLRIISLAGSKSCFVQCFLFTVFWYAQRIACTFRLNEWQVLE